MTLEWYEIIVILTDSRYQKKNEGSICQVKVKKKNCACLCVHVYLFMHVEFRCLYHYKFF